MGCSPCEQKRREREEAARLAAEQGQVINIVFDNAGCNFTLSQLSKWKEILDCGYTTNKLEAVNITEQLYGMYIGALNYTIEHIGDPNCVYANELAIILNATHVLVALGC